MWFYCDIGKVQYPLFLLMQTHKYELSFQCNYDSEIVLFVTTSSAVTCLLIITWVGKTTDLSIVSPYKICAYHP